MYVPPPQSTKELFGDLSTVQAHVASDVNTFNTIYKDYESSKDKKAMRFSLSLPDYKSRQDRFLSEYNNRPYLQPSIRNFIDEILPNGGALQVEHRVNPAYPGQHDHKHRYYFGSAGNGADKIYLFKLYDDETKWVVRMNPELTKVTCKNLTYSSLGLTGSDSFYGYFASFKYRGIDAESSFDRASNIMHRYCTYFFEDPEWQFKKGNPLFWAEVTYDGERVEPFDKLTLLTAMQKTLGAKLPPLMINYMERLERAKTASTVEALQALQLPTADFTRALKANGLVNGR